MSLPYVPTLRPCPTSLPYSTLRPYKPTLHNQVFKKAVFFRGEDEFDQLVKIARVLGTDDLYSYCFKYGVDLDPRLAQLCGIRPQVPWRRFVNADNQHLASQQVKE